MTEIVIDMRQLSGVAASDAEADYAGTFYIYPYTAYEHDDHVLTAKKLTVSYTGSVSVHLPPTEAGQGMVFDPAESMGLGYGVYAIPDSPTAVNFVDLVKLDPNTLDPTDATISAWNAALADYDERLSDLELLHHMGI